ncbi:protease inhibitors [Microplitis demolitor]|uniref:protease inhibitors n=1 Tax=Microplitis demolitor TaxID=69319 RepID=UPI00043FFF6F|nr:protease inhibitors [Microplitis demolitor]
MKRVMIMFAFLTILVTMVASKSSPEIFVSDSGAEYIVVDKEPEHCEAGKKYKVDCNLCSCLDGNNMACTRQRCNPIKNDSDQKVSWGPLWKQGDSCEPNRTFYSECNECHCGPDGSHAVCTMKACFRPTASKTD